MVKHELLSENEAKEIAKKLNTPLEKFPKIFESDPGIKELGAKPGSLIAIHRDDPVSGKYIYYRYVIKG